MHNAFADDNVQDRRRRPLRHLYRAPFPPVAMLTTNSCSLTALVPSSFQHLQLPDYTFSELTILRQVHRTVTQFEAIMTSRSTRSQTKVLLQPI